MSKKETKPESGNTQKQSFVKRRSVRYGSVTTIIALVFIAIVWMAGGFKAAMGGLDAKAAHIQSDLDEAARIVGTASAPAPIKHAELLRAWCWETGRTLLYSSDALRNGPNPIRTVTAFNAAADQLESTGWAAWVEGGAELDGKHRARVWRIPAAGRCRSR